MSKLQAPLVQDLPQNPRDPHFWQMSGGVVFPLPDPSLMQKEDFVRRFPNFLFCFIPEIHPKRKKPDGTEEEVRRAIHHATSADTATIRRYQEQGYGVYFSVNGFKREADATGELLPLSRTTEALEFVNGHYIDIDCPKDWRKLPAIEFHTKLKAFKSEAYASLLDLAHPARKILPYTPNLVIETRHGLQAVWLFDEPINLVGASEEKKQAFYSLYTQNQRELISLFSGDKQASDLVRVIRFPFTWHLKNPNNPFPCVPVFWNLADAKGVPFKAFTEALRAPAIGIDLGVGPDQTAVTRGSLPVALPPSDADQAIRIHMQRANSAFAKLTESEHQEVLSEIERLYPKKDRPSIKRLLAGAPEGERNNTLHVIASAYFQSGVAEDAAIAELDRYSGLSASETRAAVKSAYRAPKEYGWNHPIISAVLTTEERETYRAFYAEIAQKKFGKKHKGLDRIVSQDVPAEPTVAVPPEEMKKNEEDQAIVRRVQKNVQQDALVAFHHRMHKLYPEVRYLENLGEHRRAGNIYKPVTDGNALPHAVSRQLEADGLGDIQTKGSAERVVFNWMAMPSANIPAGKIEPVPDIDQSDFLPVQNGLLDLTTRRLRAYPDDEAWLTISSVAYDPDAVCPRWQQFIKEITLGDEKKASLLQEIAGYAISSSVKFQKAFVFIGGGSNGKGVFVGTLEKILGDSLCSALTLDDLETNFGPAGLERKRLNVIDEISDNYFRSDFLKRITGNSHLEADVKFKARRRFRPTAKIVFTVNTLPRIDDTTYAIYRRLTIVKFLQTFKGDALDLQLGEKLNRELSGILNWCLDGYARLMQTNQFTVHEETSRALEEMNENNSMLVRFLLSSACELPTTKTDAANYAETLDNLYRAYHRYCIETGGRYKGIAAFQHELDGLTHPLVSHIYVGKRDERTGNMPVFGVRLRMLLTSSLKP